MAFEPFNSVGGYTLGIPPIPVINENGVATLNGLQVTGLSNLGSVGNVIILGGDNGYFLQTDGMGRLTWAPGGSGNGVPGGANTQVQFNDEGNFGGDAGFTYNSINNILSVSGNIVSNNFIGSGNITIASINANGNVNFTSAPNVTLGTVSNIHIGGGVAGYFLRTDGAGNLSWAVGGGGNGTPSGNTTEVQFNNNGVFGASANFTFNPFNYVLAVPTINTTTVSISNVLTVNTTANLYTTNITGVLTATSNINATMSPNVNLGSVSNLHIQGGTNGYVLSTDGAGNLSWTTGGGSNGVPGGSNTQIQYNDTGVFGGSAFLTFNENTNTFQVAGNLIANTTQIGAGVYKFSTNSVYAATTSSTASNQLLWSTLASNVAGIDFHIIATDLVSGTRQISKISSVILGNIVQWNEYGSLLINGGVGSFDVTYRPGSVISESLVELSVTPDSTNITTYKMMITEYAP
jgi:hypothetical protein